MASKHLAIVCLLAVLVIHSAESSWIRHQIYNNASLLGSSGSPRATFQNPIVDHVAPDPSIIKLNGVYYLFLAENNTIVVLKSRRLTDFRNAERQEIYRAPAGRGNLWAPEIQQIRGKLYIYFTMDDGVIDQNHRMYVIRSLDPYNPMGQWTTARRVCPNEEVYAIDGIAWDYNGQLYFIWVGNPDSSSMGLFIARMEDPELVIEPRTLLRRPKSAWEMHGWPVNEGPFIIENEGRTFLTFSASSTFTPDYCLGIMGIDDKDPMNPANWWNDVDHCVFFRNDAENVFGPGHASFVRSPDDTELWMLYHAHKEITDEGRNRYSSAQKIEWNPDKAPRFDAAVGHGRDVQAPSGQV